MYMDEILTKENIFYGYRRANGLVGIRNKVAILSAMDNVNPIVRTISNEVSGTIAITHNAGRGQYGEDYRQTQRTIIGLGNNPNIGAVLIVSLEPVSAEIIKKDIPPIGTKVSTPIGEGIVVDINLLKQRVKVKLTSEEQTDLKEYSLSEISLVSDEA